MVFKSSVPERDAKFALVGAAWVEIRSRIKTLDIRTRIWPKFVICSHEPRPPITCVLSVDWKPNVIAGVLEAELDTAFLPIRQCQRVGNEVYQMWSVIPRLFSPKDKQDDQGA